MTNVELTPSSSFNIHKVSKGFGRLQAEIMDAVRRAGQVSANRLAWEVAEKLGHIQRSSVNHPLPSGGLRASFYTSFRRSITLLIGDRKTIKALPRKLQSMDQVVDLYPFMTRDLRIKELRHRLLPHAREYLRTQTSKYNLEENELYLEQRAPEADRASWRTGWLTLEARLCVALANVPSSGLEPWIAILARGREVFVRNWSRYTPNTTSRFRYDGALGELLTAVMANPGGHPRSDAALPGDLLTFYQQCFPDSAVRHVALKSQLHGIWENPALGASRLAVTFKNYLLSVESALVSSLPGHVAGSGEHRLFSRGFPRKPTFDGLLDQLFARDLYRAFEFLSIV